MASTVQRKKKSALWVVHPVDPGRQAMGGSVKLARELSHRLPTEDLDIVLWGVSPEVREAQAGHGRLFRRVSRTDRLWDFVVHLWARCALTRVRSETLVQVFRLDFLLPFLLLHPSVQSVAILDQSLTYISTEFRRLRGVLTWAFRLVETFCLRRVDRVVTDATSAAYYRSLYPWIDGKLEIKSTGPVDLERFAGLPSKSDARHELGIAREATVVVFVGRLEKVKNLDLLTSAVGKLGTEFPDVWLLVVGRGSYLEDLKRASKDIPGVRTLFLGEQPYDRVPLILRASDVLALTSHMEGSPTVVREALAAGVPVVSTDVGDVGSILVEPALGQISAARADEFALHLAETLRRKPTKEETDLLAEVAQNHSIEDFSEFMLSVYGAVRGKEAYDSESAPNPLPVESQS